MRYSCASGRNLTLAACLVVALGLLLSAAGCRFGSDARTNRKAAFATGAQLAQQYPWLADETKDWREDVDFSTQAPGLSDLAAFPIGNGQAFAYTGMAYPLGTLDNITGPEYQKTQGFFGQIAPGLCIGGKPLFLPRQSSTWVRRSGIVRSTQADAEGLTLDVYDFAAPKLPAIVRIMVATNAGKSTRRSISFSQSFSSGGEALPDGLRMDRGSVRIRAGVLGARCRTVKGILVPPPLQTLTADVHPFAKIAETASALTCDIGTLRAGESAAKVFYMACTADEATEQQTLAALNKQGFDILKAQHDDYEAFYAEGPTLTCDDARVSDLLDISQHIMRCQQAYEGGYSPMDKYTYTWVRDSNGPTRYMLATGHYDSVKRYLEYHFKGCCQTGKIYNNLGLNMKLDGDVPEPDWSSVPVERAEVPSFVILQHYWYWRCTADSDLIKRHWKYLRRCLLAQQIDDRSTLPFHGDETYRFPGYLLFSAKQDAPDYVSLEAQSADSAFEYVAAASALSEMASSAGHGEEAADYTQRAGRVREATERYYWQPQYGFYAPAMSDFSTEVHRWPFTPINLRPIWIGYAQPDSRQLTNLRQSLPYLFKPAGTLKMTPTFGYYVSMLAGYALYDLAAVDDPTASLALKGVIASADKAGGFAEMNKPDDTPSDAVWGKHRFRPWEGGINTEAVLFYLTGLRVDAANKKLSVDPHLPEGWKGFEIKGLRAGGCRFNLKLDGTQCTFTRTDGSGENWEVAIRGGVGPQTTKPVSSVVVSLTPRGLKTPIERKESFDYGLPSLPSGARLVVLTWSKETAQEYLSYYKDAAAAIDTKLAFPASYLRAALLKPDGSRRVDELVLDVSKYSGAFKRPEYWAEGGEGGKILAAFKNAGGRVTEPRTVRTPPAPPGGLPGQ